jgi:hypothetical protein
MALQQQFLAPYGFFTFAPCETPFYYTVNLDGHPLGCLAFRFGELHALRSTQKGDEDNPYYVSELHWYPVSGVTSGLKYLVDGAEDRFPGLNINEAYRAAQSLNAYNRTASFR